MDVDLWNVGVDKLYYMVDKLCWFEVVDELVMEWSIWFLDVLGNLVGKDYVVVWKIRCIYMLFCFEYIWDFVYIVIFFVNWILFVVNVIRWCNV